MATEDTLIPHEKALESFDADVPDGMAARGEGSGIQGIAPAPEFSGDERAGGTAEDLQDDLGEDPLLEGESLDEADEDL